MNRLVIAVVAIFILLPSQVYGQYTRSFSPLRGIMVAQAATQDSVTVVRKSSAENTVQTDSLQQAAPIEDADAQTPAGALYRSLAFAGWGQWKNGRRDKAILFFAAETFCIGGYLYEHARYSSGDYTGSVKDAIRTDRNTYLLYWMIAKVFCIMDAYVDAQFSSYNIDDITPGELTEP